MPILSPAFFLSVIHMSGKYAINLLIQRSFIELLEGLKLAEAPQRVSSLLMIASPML